MAKDLTGKTYCDLTVIKFVGTADRGGRKADRLWLCECSCGQTCEVRTFELSQGRVRRCSACASKRAYLSHRSRRESNQRFVREYEHEVRKGVL